MKILYIGRERRDAEAVATALRVIAQNVTLSWAQSLGHAAKWVEENRDLAAIVVDAQIHGGEWPASLKDLRSLPLRPAVVVVVAEGTRPKFESLGPPADGYVTRGETFSRDLPVAVSSAVTRVRGYQPPPPAPREIAEPERHLEATPEKSHSGGRWKKAFGKVRSAERTNASQGEGQLAEAMAVKSDLERRLADVENSLRQREELWSAERAAAAEHHEYLDALVHLERMARADIEQKLADATAALEDAQQRHVAALTAARLAHEHAAAEQLTQQQRDLEAQIAEEADKRRAVEEMLAQAVSAHEGAERRYAGLERAPGVDAQLADLQSIRDGLDRQLVEAADAIEQGRQREAELAGQIQHERATRVALEQAIAHADANLRDTRQRHDAALAAAAAELAARQAHFDRELSQTTADRDRLGSRLNEAALALDQAQRDYQVAAVEIERLKQREAGLSAQLADLQAIRDGVDRQLVEAAEAIEQGRQREAELVEQIQHERAMRAALEQAIADADANLRNTRQQHDAALAAAAAELAERQAHFDRELSQTAADRDGLRQQLNGAEAALDQAQRDHHSAAAEVDRLTQHEADLTAQLAGAQSDRSTLEGKLAAAVRETAEANECAARERVAAEKRQADLEANLVHEIDARETLEQTLSETRSAALDAERWFREEADALRAQAVERAAHFEARLASERLEHESRLAEMRKECERLGRARVAADAAVHRLSADLSEANRVLDDTRRQFQATLDRVSSEHATALAALTAAVAERDERLNEQALRHEVSLRASERARTELRERLQAALAARRDEIEHVQEKLMAVVETMESAKRQQEVLHTDAERVSEPPQPQDEGRADSHRRIDQPEPAMVRCTQNSALV